MGVLDGDYLKGTRLVQDSNGDYFINLYLCSKDEEPSVEVLVTCHPYDTALKKIGSLPQAKIVKIPAGKCAIVTFGPYPKDPKPHENYIDVLTKDGANWMWNGGNVDLLSSLVLPPRENGRTTFAFVSPIPYPWRFDLARYGPCLFFIRRVSGLPRGWRLTFIRPEVGKRFRMSPETKHWPLMIEVSTKQSVNPGLRFSIDLEIGMVDRSVPGGRTRVFSHPVAARPTEPPPFLADERFVDADIETIPFNSLRRRKFIVPEWG